MLAFDLGSQGLRDDVVVECARNGLLILGCGKSSIRLIPPFVVNTEDIDTAVGIMESAIKRCSHGGFRHPKKICEFIHCSRHVS